MRDNISFYFFGLVTILVMPLTWRPFLVLAALLVIIGVACVMLFRRLRYSLFVPVLLACFLTACAGSDRALVYTEEGLRAAEKGWDGAYEAEAVRCEKIAEPKTPEMEQCFGATYDANAAVGIAVESAVSLLKTYWRRRAAGEKPDLTQVLKEIQALIDDLPPEVKAFFDRVRGI